MELITGGWPWWLAGISVAVIMHFIVKRANTNLTVDQRMTVEAIEEKVKKKAKLFVSVILKFGVFWVVVVIIITTILVVYFKR
jgi:hypothetical protein